MYWETMHFLILTKTKIVFPKAHGYFIRKLLHSAGFSNNKNSTFKLRCLKDQTSNAWKSCYSVK